MSLINHELENRTMTVYLNGHVDSANAEEIEKEINEVLSGADFDSLVINAENLTYISSAGLRVILRLKKAYDSMEIIEVSSEVYDIFQMTGFTELISVNKAFRQLSVEGCEVIGAGANGTVYRYNPDTIIKVYNEYSSLEEIKRQRELARAAFVMGIPTAIPYDVVRVGNAYGSVYELLNAKSFAALLKSGEYTLDEITDMEVKLLKTIHATEITNSVLPDAKETVVKWVKFSKDYIPEEKYNKFIAMAESIPDTKYMIHGDFHYKNIMMQNGEVLLIDMDTLATGHPIIEFAAIFNSNIGYADVDKNNTMEFFGLDFETTSRCWDQILHKYFAGYSEEEIQKIADKAMLIGFARIMRRTIRRDGYSTEEGTKIIESARNHVLELIDRVDSLYF